MDLYQNPQETNKLDHSVHEKSSLKPKTAHKQIFEIGESVTVYPCQDL